MNNLIPARSISSDSLFGRPKLAHLWLWLTIITLLRVLFIACNGREFDGDEAQYWQWSHQLAWGYHSKPPLIAWMIALSREWLGHSEFAARFTVPFTYALSSCFIYNAAKQIYNSVTAYYAALLWLLLPGVSFSAAIISTDPFMLLFWSLALWAYVLAYQTGRLHWWLLTSLSCALAILTKYTAVFIVISIIINLMISPLARKQLKTFKPYFALISLILLLLPNLRWNYLHQFATLAHVSNHNIAIAGWAFHPLKLLEFIAAQFGLFGPLLFICLLQLMNPKKWSQYHETDKLWLCFIAPLLLVVLIEAALVRAYANWGAGIYLAATIWVAHHLVLQQRLKIINYSLLIGLIFTLIFYSAEMMVANKLIALPDKINIYKRQQGWQELGAQFSKYYQANARYLFDNRMVLFKSLYYSPIKMNQAYSWNPSAEIEQQFDLPTTLNDSKGKDFILVTERRDYSVENKFKTHKVLKRFTIKTSCDKEHDLYWIQLKSFKGY